MPLGFFALLHKMNNQYTLARLQLQNKTIAPLRYYYVTQRAYLHYVIAISLNMGNMVLLWDYSHLVIVTSLEMGNIVLYGAIHI